MDDLPIMPKFWHCRGGTSDLNFVLARMRVIPPAEQQTVADEYERLLFLDGGRRLANEYLHETARPYRDKIRQITMPKKGAPKAPVFAPQQNRPGVPVGQRKNGLLERMMTGDA